ncbi:MAG: GTP pyrophosphokinase family protein [Candidatus Bathyarchaeia archaeon]
MVAKGKTEEAVEWYSENFEKYQKLAQTVEKIVKDLLKKEKINFHDVTSRAKDIEKYNEKASKEKYKDPRSEIMDMAGIRVITYLDSDAKKVAEIIKKSFKYFPEFSVDKSEQLGQDRAGYRSVHCICNLGEKFKAPENEEFVDCLFEIQIRTILQHAWAEFEHDRNYKFKGVLPLLLKRRLAMVSGNLELMDWTFESIAMSFNEYTIGLHEKTSKGDLTPLITSASLSIYLGKKLEELVKNGLQPVLYFDSKVIGELATMGITNLDQLEKAIPEDFVKTNLELKSYSTYTSTLIDLMIIYNANDYFEKAWKQTWNSLDRESINLYKHYGVQIDQLMEKYNLNVEDFSDQYEPPDYEEEYEPPEYEPDYEPPEEEPPDFEEYESPEEEYEPPEEEPPEPEPPEEEQPDVELPEEEYEPPEEEYEPPEEDPPEFEPQEQEPPDYEPPEDEPPDTEPPEEEPPDSEPEDNPDEPP